MIGGEGTATGSEGDDRKGRELTGGVKKSAEWNRHVDGVEKKRIEEAGRLD